MRLSLRRRGHEEEEESAFVSMTDMTVSFLFIVILLLAFFASQFKNDETVARTLYEAIERERDELSRKLADAENRIEELEEEVERLRRQLEDVRPRDPLEEYLAGTADARRDLLIRLREYVLTQHPDLTDVLTVEGDALRFRGDGLFDSGSSELGQRQQAIIRSMAAGLREVLPCFTIGPYSSWDEACNPAMAVIEAVQIEGHTDSSGIEERNLTLSTDRANSTYLEMIAQSREINELRNLRDQPVLSVAGYGQMRPVASNASTDGRATNRRIDLRFILHIPRRVSEIDGIRRALDIGEPLEDAP